MPYLYISSNLILEIKKTLKTRNDMLPISEYNAVDNKANKVNANRILHTNN